MGRYHIDITTRTFHFKEPAGTSRGVYRTRVSRVVHLTHDDLPGIVGVGECASLPKLSCDDLTDYEAVLRRRCDDVCARGAIDVDALRDVPSMLFGLRQLGSSCIRVAAGRCPTRLSPVARRVSLSTAWCGWVILTRWLNVWSRNSLRASLV